MRPYAPLRIRSNYSLLTGASPLDAILGKAARAGLPTIALTDENNIYGAVAFYKRAKYWGIRPVLGTLLITRQGSVLLLVKNAKGYENLCELLSRRNTEKEFNLPVRLAELQEGLFILTHSPALVESMARNLDRDRLRLECIRPASDRKRERKIVETARRYGVGLVGSCNVYFADRQEADICQLLHAIKTHRELFRLHEGGIRPSCGYLRTPEEFAELFADIPEAITATRQIADSCWFDLLDCHPVFPKIKGDALKALRGKARAGAHGKYGQIPAKAWYRLNRECDVIGKLGFADYFLVVEDIVRHARTLGTPVAGRGSGASSMVAYCLGITNVDPLRYNLPFERFLNEMRDDFPDLDLDFCLRRRDKIIDYVYKTYGDDHVAMISTHVTMQPRLAFRETAKALGISHVRISEMAERIEAGLPREKWQDVGVAPRILEHAISFAERCSGFPHHISVHCGGIVITPGPIYHRTALQRAAKGVVVTQYDKDAAESVGLVKLDILGNRALSAVSESIRLVRGDVGGSDIDPETLPVEDSATARLLAAGETVGVNQLESPGIRHLLRQLRPGNVRDVMKVLALIRPGAASLGMKEAFIRRARGMDGVPAMDGRLDGILGETHGVMLYEDDALLVAIALADLSPAEADRFRRAVSKCRTDPERRALSEKFLGFCSRNGVDPAISADLWTQMAKFNAYSFCRAHAASYARIAWANAFMKAHWLPEFWVGALNNNDGMYDKWVYVEAAKREGVLILSPCVNRSGEEFTLEKSAIRIGLNRIRGLTSRAQRNILKNRPFTGLTDLIVRTWLRKGEIGGLIGAGALDFTGRARTQLREELEMLFGSAKDLRGQPSLFPVPPASTADRCDYSEAGKWQEEWEIMGLSPGRHPVAYMRSALLRKGILPSRFIQKRIGQHIRLCGIPAAARATPSKKGRNMCFVTLSDEDGMFEVTLLPDVYSRYRKVLGRQGGGLFWVAGKAESQYDALSITADAIGGVD